MTSRRLCTASSIFSEFTSTVWSSFPVRPVTATNDWRRFYNSLMKIRPILADQSINVVKRLIDLRRRLPEIVQDRLQPPARFVQVFERGFQVGTILLNHVA